MLTASTERCVCRIAELTARHRQDNDLQTERLCSAQQQADRLLQSKERAHKLQVNALEDQVCTLAR